MKPYGHGVDLVNIDEMSEFAMDADAIERCFTKGEQDRFPTGPTRTEHIAGRYAAKEAVLKALGTGQGNGIAFCDVIIERTDGCPPTVRLTNGAARAAEAARIVGWLLSITHTRQAALASVIALTA